MRASERGISPHEGRWLALISARKPCSLGPQNLVHGPVQRALQSHRPPEAVGVGAQKLIDAVDPEFVAEYVDRVGAEQPDVARVEQAVPAALRAQPRLRVRPPSTAGPPSHRTLERRYGPHGSARPPGGPRRSTLSKRSGSGWPSTRRRSSVDWASRKTRRPSEHGPGDRPASSESCRATEPLCSGEAMTTSPSPRRRPSLRKRATLRVRSRSSCRRAARNGLRGRTCSSR